MAEDDRDKRKHHTPPPGVLKQIAPATPPETWEENRARLTPIHPTPLPPIAIGRTPTPDDVLQNLDRRSKETKNTSIDTLRMVETLRNQTREDLRDVHERLDSTNTKVEATLGLVNDVRAEQGRQGGQNELIITMIRDLRTEHQHLRITELDVDKTFQNARIENAVDEAKAKRAIKVAAWKKAIWIIGLTLAGIGAVIKAYLIAQS